MKARRAFSFIMALILISAFPCQAMAASVNSESESLEEIIAQIQSDNPTATISVDNGTINVFVPMSPESSSRAVNPGDYSVMSTETTYTATEGGLWTNFKNPWYTYVNPDTHVLPYGVVYLPSERALDLYLAMTTKDLWEFILDHPLTGATVETIAAQILMNFGLSLSTSSVIFLYSASMLYLYDTVNINSFANALSSGSGAVRIDYATLGGWPVNYYYSWDGVTVTNSPWQDFNPTFHRGIYSTADL